MGGPADRMLGRPARDPLRDNCRPAALPFPRVPNKVSQAVRLAGLPMGLYISAKTVEHHVSRILTNLAVRSGAEAVALAASPAR